MKSFNLWKKTAVAITLLGLVFPFFAQADFLGGRLCKNGSLSDFLDAQGSQSTFFKPVPDYVGWASKFLGCPDPDDPNAPTDPPTGNFGLVDYAGLANEYIEDNGGESLHTKVRGHVKECKFPGYKDKVKIIVSIFTQRALGFAEPLAELCETDFDFEGTPTNFGNKTLDVLLKGKPPAVGPVIFITSFTMDRKELEDEGYPDYLSVAFGTEYAPAKLYFNSTTVGKRPDGTPAYMQVIQEATVSLGDEDWDYTIEEVNLFDIFGVNN